MRTDRRARLRRVAAALVLFLLSAAAAEAIWIAWRTRPLYRRVAAGGRGWRGRVHAADPALGFAPIPGASGAHTFPIGPDLPMRYDERGFRVPVDAAPAGPPRRPLVLALGGSFTYGDACRAEDVFAYRVAQRLGGSAVNAGVPAWGLVSMLLRARRVIPELEPDLVLVQYSTWLVERAVSPIAPTYAGLVPVPHFVSAPGGGLEIRPPAFATIAFDLPLSDYARRPTSLAGLVSFFFRVGLPLYVHDDYHLLRYRLRTALLGAPAPARDGNAVVARVYGELAALSRAAGARLVVVVLDRGPWPAHVPKELRALDAVVVDAQRALLERVDVEDPLAYSRAYQHWRGDPPVQVDPHPNSSAHAIISEAILREIGGHDTQFEK